MVQQQQRHLTARRKENRVEPSQTMVEKQETHSPHEQVINFPRKKTRKNNKNEPNKRRTRIEAALKSK